MNDSIHNYYYRCYTSHTGETHIFRSLSEMSSYLHMNRATIKKHIADHQLVLSKFLGEEYFLEKVRTTNAEYVKLFDNDISKEFGEKSLYRMMQKYGDAVVVEKTGEHTCIIQSLLPIPVQHPLANKEVTNMRFIGKNLYLYV